MGRVCIAGDRFQGSHEGCQRSGKLDSSSRRSIQCTQVRIDTIFNDLMI
jgi:hypothetical protein